MHRGCSLLLSSKPPTSFNRVHRVLPGGYGPWGLLNCEFPQCICKCLTPLLAPFGTWGRFMILGVHTNLRFRLLAVLAIPLRGQIVLIPRFGRMDYDCHTPTSFAFSILRPMNRRRPSSPPTRFLGGLAFLLRSMAYTFNCTVMVQLLSIIKSYQMIQPRVPSQFFDGVMTPCEGTQS